MSSLTEAAARPHVRPSLTRRAYLNAVASFLDFGVRAAVSFAITPILVAGLGELIYGFWQMIVRAVGYLSIADGRAGQVLKWVVANHQSSDDPSAARRSVGSALAFVILVAPLLGLIGIAFSMLAPALLGVPDAIATHVRLSSMLLVVNVIIARISSIPDSVLMGMNIGYKRMGVVAGINLLGGGLMLAAVYLGWGLVGLALAYVIQTVIGGYVFWRLVRAYVPWFGADRVSLEEVRGFFRLSVWYNLWGVVDKLLFYADVLILGVLASASLVTTYVISSYVTQTLVAVVAMMIAAAVPGLGKMIGQKDFARVMDVRHEMSLVIFWVATAIGTTILLWNYSFVGLWVGADYFAGPLVNLLLTLLAVQLLFIRKDNYLIDLSLDVRRKVTWGIVSAVVSLALMLWLTPLLGAVGMCLGMLAGRTILVAAYPRIISSFMGVSADARLPGYVRPILLMGMMFGASFVAGTQPLVTNWIWLVAGTLLTFLASLLAAYYLGFSRTQRELLAVRVRAAGTRVALP